MEMPEPVKAYFDAERRNDADAVAALFSTDAIVKDEGATHRGASAIRNWWGAAKEKTQHVTAPLDLAARGEQISVCALVSGDFPNSPVTLDFAFTLQDGKIAELEIG